MAYGNYLHYKGFRGSVDWSEAGGYYFGLVIGPNIVFYTADDNEDDITPAFRRAVDQYLRLCKGV